MGNSYGGTSDELRDFVAFFMENYKDTPCKCPGTHTNSSALPKMTSRVIKRRNFYGTFVDSVL